MKKVLMFLFIFSMIFINNNLFSKNFVIKSEIKQGLYIPGDLVTLKNIRNLPIPKSDMDYSFLQSIGSVTNIVLANFKVGKYAVKLITDSNADGVVDKIYTWYPETNKIQRTPNASKVITSESFQKMKENILNGEQANMSPNKEGIKYIKTSLDKNAALTSVIKAKSGYRVTVNDADSKSDIRADFSVSDNGNNGVDISFEVKYLNRGSYRVKPIILNSVYSKKARIPI